MGKVRIGPAGGAGEVSGQRCPICSAVVEPNVRYANYICFDCCGKAVDETGRKLGFGNESPSGGFVAWYKDTNETRNSHICYIDGIECWADEAHMGGIVIRVYDDEMKIWCPKPPVEVSI